MTDKTAKPEPAPAEPLDPGAEAPDLAEGARLAELEAEAARLKDQLLRALAEQENVRRRAQRDKEDAIKFAATGFARDLLPTADNLRRALDSVQEDEIRDEALKSLVAGVAATERALIAAFERNAIRRIEPLGEKFDHNLHQAMFEVENTGKPPGTVVQVLQAGYTLNDRLLRPALVGLAKGPAATAGPGGAEGDRRIDGMV